MVGLDLGVPHIIFAFHDLPETRQALRLQETMIIKNRNQRVRKYLFGTRHRASSATRRSRPLGDTDNGAELCTEAGNMRAQVRVQTTSTRTPKILKHQLL